MKKTILITFLFLTSCSYNYNFSKGTFIFTKNTKIGVLLFSNLSTYSNADFLVTDSITSKLSELQIKVIDSGTLTKYYSDFRSVSYNDLFKIKKISEKSNLDYLITGYVEEFGYRQSVSGVKEAPVISFYIYIYDMNTIKPVFQGFYSKSNLNNYAGTEEDIIRLLKEATQCFVKDISK